MPNETIAKLRESFADATLTPRITGYDEAKATFNLLVEQRPGLVARPSSADEAAAIVDAARAAGVRVAPQGTGHGAGALAPLDDAVLVRCERMTAVDVDPERRTARVEAGARWRDVIPALSEHGLTALHGYAGGINVVGYTLSGGIGWLVRKHGLQTNAVTALDVVTADGSQQRVDAENDPDLFWALRGGGGGNFALVTAVEFGVSSSARSMPAPSCFPTSAPARSARHGASGRRRRRRSSPRRSASPASRRCPRCRSPSVARRSRSCSARTSATRPAADELLAPLRDLGPEMDTFATVATPTLATMAGDPPGPVSAATMASLVGELTADGLDGDARRGRSRRRVVDRRVRAAPPRRRRRPRGAGRRSARQDRCRFHRLRGRSDHGAGDARAGAGAPRPDRGRDRAALERQAARLVRAALLAGPAYGADVLARLREVKARVDPEGMFLANHSIE